MVPNGKANDCETMIRISTTWENVANKLEKHENVFGQITSISFSIGHQISYAYAVYSYGRVYSQDLNSNINIDGKKIHLETTSSYFLLDPQKLLESINLISIHVIMSEEQKLLLLPLRERHISGAHVQGGVVVDLVKLCHEDRKFSSIKWNFCC